MAQITSIPVFADETARDAIVGWDEGDIIYVVGVGLEFYDGEAWQTVATLADLA